MFKSADPDYFISHVDLHRIAEYRPEAAKLTGEASIALLFRHLSASRVVTIAQIEGRVRAAGSEFVLACDMRFAARESAIFGQFEPAFGTVPGGAPSSTSRGYGPGRALEVMLSAQRLRRRARGALRLDQPGAARGGADPALGLRACARPRRRDRNRDGSPRPARARSH